jgi:hypothetical protein
MKESTTVHQVFYIVSIQSEYRRPGSPVFRGTLETVAGQQFEFSTLAELESLVCEIGGWIDPPPLTNEGGEASASCQGSAAKKGDDEPNEFNGSLIPKLKEGKKCTSIS